MAGRSLYDNQTTIKAVQNMNVDGAHIVLDQIVPAGQIYSLTLTAPVGYVYEMCGMEAEIQALKTTALASPTSGNLKFTIYSKVGGYAVTKLYAEMQYNEPRFQVMANTIIQTATITNVKPNDLAAQVESVNSIIIDSVNGIMLHFINNTNVAIDFSKFVNYFNLNFKKIRIA